MTKSAKRFRSVLCSTVAFLLSVAITVFCMLAVVKFTALNTDYAKKIITKSGYAEKLHSELKEHFVSYGSACNVNSSFFDPIFENVITTDQITAYTTESLKNFYGNAKQEVPTKEIEQELLKALKVYAEENGFTLDEELNGNLEVMSREMGELYSAYVDTFASSYFRSASNMLARYMPLFKWAFIGLGVFSLLAVVVIRLSFAKAKNYLRYYIYAAAGSTLMLAVAPAAALIMKIGSRINVANPSLYGFASAFINNIFVYMLFAAAAMAVVTVLLAVIRIACIKKAKKIS